jgi:hypothetical protein
MKRLLVLVAVLVPLSLFVSGCGDKGASSGKSTEMSPAQKEQQKENMKKMDMQAKQKWGGTGDKK